MEHFKNCYFQNYFLYDSIKLYLLDLFFYNNYFHLILYLIKFSNFLFNLNKIFILKKLIHFH